jgi:hypothetical protein
MELCYFPPSDIICVWPTTKPRGKQRCVTEDSGAVWHFWPWDYSRQRPRTAQPLNRIHSLAYKVRSHRTTLTPPFLIRRITTGPTSPTIQGSRTIRIRANQAIPGVPMPPMARTRLPAHLLADRPMGRAVPKNEEFSEAMRLAHESCSHKVIFPPAA